MAAILAGQADHVDLGNLEARRDWGHARDYVEAMWLMLQQDSPDDYVVATGQARTIRELVATAFSLAGLEWEKYMRVNRAYMRPAEVDYLCGDASKARAKLGWQPRVSFAEMIHEMLTFDLQQVGLDPSEHLRAPAEVAGE